MLGPGWSAEPTGTQLELPDSVEFEVAPATNPVQGLPRVGSALKTDPYHAFPDIVDNFASGATSTTLRPGATLQQIGGSLNGVAGRFEWIIENGQVTHRMFVPGGTVNGVPIKP
jgi:filamentous hemagglutinin